MKKRPTNPKTTCFGCGREVTHKKCPAHGTPIYCNPSHPEWGSASDKRLADLRRRASLVHRRIQTPLELGKGEKS